jgi:hypothetical protein
MPMLYLSAFALFGAVPVAPMECQQIPNWEQVVGKQPRWIVIGEVHGSNEIPEAFVNAVCLTSRLNPVVVALEQPTSDQPAIDAFMQSDGGLAAQGAFLKAQMWHFDMKDGRSSEAYFQLFESLRRMFAAGLIAKVVAFQPSTFKTQPTPAEYEQAMADLLIAAAQSDTTVMVLVGNVHAMRTDVPWQPTYTPMAGRLPREQTVSLNASAQGGAAWNCHGADSCGPHALPDPTPNHQVLGVEMHAEDAMYSGTLHLGRPTTASTPKFTVE